MSKFITYVCFSFIALVLIALFFVILIMLSPLYAYFFFVVLTILITTFFAPNVQSILGVFILVETRQISFNLTFYADLSFHACTLQYLPQEVKKYRYSALGCPRIDVEQKGRTDYRSCFISLMISLVCVSKPMQAKLFISHIFITTSLIPRS